MKHPLSTLLALLLAACPPLEPTPARGELTVALSGEAEGVRYTLANAQLSLSGPEMHRVIADGEDRASISLLAGRYTLTLEDGYELREEATGELRTATLLSENPQEVVIGPGVVTEVVLRFELDEEPVVAGDRGELEVSLAIGPEPDSQLGMLDPCLTGLRINEVDYDQEGADEREFVEILHTGECPAPLAELALELVNGQDGRVYARIALAPAADALAPGARLVVGSQAVLAGLDGATTALLLPSALQNGPDALRLVVAEAHLDGVAYEGTVLDAGEGESVPAPPPDRSLSRCLDGDDHDDNATDFVPAAPTPGRPNACS